MAFNALQLLMANLQPAVAQYAGGMPELMADASAGRGPIVGGPETQAVDGQLARNVAPTIGPSDRIPIPQSAPRPRAMPTPTPRPAQAAAPMMPMPDVPAAPGAEVAPMPTPRAAVSDADTPTATGMGFENLLAGKDIRSLLGDFMAGAASSQGGGIGGIATGYLGAAGNRESREERKRQDLAAQEAARIKAEDRLYGRSRDAASDARADRRLEADMTKEERADAREAARLAREDRRDSLSERRTSAEIAKMDREALGEKPLTRSEVERLTMDYRKSITPDNLTVMTPEERTQLDSDVANYRRGLSGGAEPSSGSSSQAAPGKVPGTAKEGDVKQQGDGSFVQLKSGKWVPFQ